MRLIPDPSKVTPEYLTAFLNTKYGSLDVKRRARVSINQSNVNAEELKRVEIPLLSGKLQKEISRAFGLAFDCIRKSEAEFTQAQSILENNIGFGEISSGSVRTFIRSYSEVKEAERIDAEYFHPRYIEVQDVVRKYENGWGRIEDLAHIVDENFNPDESSEYRYIELANISGNGEITNYMNRLGLDLPTRARRKVRSGDLIVSSIEGSLDAIALIDDDLDCALCSTGFYVLRSDAFNPETLLVLLKSIVGQSQLKRGCSGTILTAIGKHEFQNIILPKLGDGVQESVRDKVVSSFKLRKYSRHLLEEAKRAVEIAIESGEKAALARLSNKVMGNGNADRL